MRKINLLLSGIPLLFKAQIPFSNSTRNLDKNFVKAGIYTVNNKFWNIIGNNMPAYEVPKGKGTHAQFGSSIWIGGMDHLGKLHLTANTYRQTGTDVWPGPLDTTNIGALSFSSTIMYNTLWKVDCNDINAFTTAFNNGSVYAGTYTVPADIVNYPARGINKFQKNLQPYYDANGNGIYSPVTDGDYPIIKGHQQVLSIFNDSLGKHTETGAPAMGLEIHERSYAYSDPNVPDSMNAINYATFYNYTIFNRSSETYSNVFISNWSDVDVGYYLDDYIGTDTINNFAYGYNGKPNDPQAFGLNGYGNKPPVISHCIIRTPCSTDGVDNNHNGLIDEPGEQFVMDRATYFNNSVYPFPSAITVPTSAINYYGYMSGKWKDGTPFTEGGNGYGGIKPTHYVFSGDPSTNSGWTEATASITPGDRRIIFSSGPFTFPANSKVEWGYALVFSQDTTQAVNTISQLHSRVQRDVRVVRNYDLMHLAAQCTPPVFVNINEKKLFESGVRIYPNPAKEKIEIELNDGVMKKIKLFDLSGRQILIKESIGQRGTIDLSEIENGIYILEIETEVGKIISKVVRD